MHFAYLYSRYPVVSQTFCDTEMLALERRGCSFEIGSIHPPQTSLRHEHAARLLAPIYYAPPQEILKIGERRAQEEGRWPGALVARHEQRYGVAGKGALRARNALYFADLFQRHGVEHFHVHFANRAAQTALFVKAISGIPFSITAHGQDFMVDLGSLELLREICAEAEFVAAETDYSCELLRQRCPEAAGKIHRVYNGMDLANFPAVSVAAAAPNESVRILSVGRLVEFKGFKYLIEACAELVQRGCDFHCEIVGEGPLREHLLELIEQSQLRDRVVLAGALSQEEIFARLRDCDIFALASVVDQAGASDVFPTVILEAMASARAVVSTTVAGIPESVAVGETGLLVPPNDAGALANALERLIRDPKLRARFGAAGRARVERNFQVEITVEPLERLLLHSHPERSAAKRNAAEGSRGDAGKPPHETFPEARRDPSTPLRSAQDDRSIQIAPKIAYLIARWPDETLPDLETEIAQMRVQGLEVLPIVCRLGEGRIPPGDFALQLEFLPDAFVLEAEWQQERRLARALEAEHGGALQRLPGVLFLEQARYALHLRKLLARERVTHLHATSSRALVGALLVRKAFVARASSLRDSKLASLKLAPLSLTAAIEARPTLPRNALAEALRQVDGGRVFDPRLIRNAPGDFLLETGPSLLARVKLDRRENFWKEWSERLESWSVPQ